MEIAQVSKLLLPNDCGPPFARTNQDGIHVSKSSQDLLDFFPLLNPDDINPEMPMEIFDIADSKPWHFRFIYFNGKQYGTSTRDEYRITSGPKEFGYNSSMSQYLNSKNAKPDDVVVFRKYKDIYYIEWPTKLDIGDQYDKITTPDRNRRWSIFWQQPNLVSQEKTRENLEQSDSKRESQIQKNSAITGKKAEDYFMDWAYKNFTDWGPLEDRTDQTGLGHDFYFPDKEYFVEVKGCIGEIEPIRMTDLEWKTSEINGNSYWLAIVCRIDSELFENPEVFMIQDPFIKLQNNAKPHTVTQVYYSISAGDLLPLLNHR